MKLKQKTTVGIHLCTVISVLIITFTSQVVICALINWVIDPGQETAHSREFHVAIYSMLFLFVFAGFYRRLLKNITAAGIRIMTNGDLKKLGSSLQQMPHTNVHLNAEQQMALRAKSKWNIHISVLRTLGGNYFTQRKKQIVKVLQEQD